MGRAKQLGARKQVEFRGPQRVAGAVTETRRRNICGGDDLPFDAIGWHPPERKEKGEPIHVPRYAAWGEMGKGKPEVLEVSDDLEELRREWDDPPVLRREHFRQLTKMERRK